MKKRAFGILLVVMAAILAFTFAGCSDEKGEPTPTNYTVTFSAGEGTGTAPTGGNYAAGATFALPAAEGLTKAGYHFTGWNDGTADYAAGATYTMPAKAVTFTAQWAEDVQPPVTYAVTFSAGEGTGTAPTGGSYAEGATFALPEAEGLTKAGYHFTGWNDGTADYAAGATYTMPAKAVTFTAQWAEDVQPPVTYAVTFSAGEGTGTAPTGGSYAEGATFALPEAEGLTKAGYHFTGWNDGTADYAAGATYTMPAKAVTFTAQWAEDVQPPVTHTVTFDPNNDGATWAEQIADGNTVAKPAPDPTIASGKLFRYWATDEGVEYSFDTPVTGDMTLTAVYAYKVTFEAGEGATGTVEPQWVKMWTPAGITLPDGTGLSHSADKMFGGWTDGTNTYAAGDRYVGTGNHTLTAVWNSAAAEITVSFETTFRGEGTAPASQTGKHAGDTITLPANTFTATSSSVGYVFAGWYVQGGSNTVTYQPGETYTIPSDFAETTLVFMAKWEKGKFTVTYKPGDHATGENIVQTNVTGGNIYLLDEITFTPESNYTFAGWVKEGGSDLLYAGDSYMLGENTVFVAQWVHAYVNYDNDFTAQIMLNFDTNDGFLYDGTQDVVVNLTFTLDGTAISITLDGETAANGTLDENGLAIALTCGGRTITFGQVAQQPTEPTVTFGAGEGSGTAPTATVTYEASSGMYRLVLPANTYTAPNGKEFKCWSIGGNEYNAGTSYMATSGETITITAVWQNTAQPAFEGTVFEGNCTTPQKGGILPSGGETYVKFIISADKTKVQYTLSDGTVKEADLTDESSSTYKPDKYGSDSFYYSVRMETTAYYLLVQSDMSKLSICNNNDELLDNGEFTVGTGEASEYTNVALRDLAGKDFVPSGDATEIYNGYTTLNFSWDANFSSYKVKLGGMTLSRSYTTDENTEALSGTTFTATHSSSGQVMTFAFIQNGDTYQMIILSIKDSSGTELLTAPVTLVEKTA